MDDLSGIYQMQLDPNRGVSPEVMQRILRGRRARNEIEEIQGGNPMAQALRLQDAELGGMTGSGFSAQAPTLIEGLSVALQRMEGAKRAGGLNEQIAALRGEEADLDAALEEQKRQEQLYRDQMARENSMAQMRFQKQQAAEAEKRRIARENLKAERLREEEANKPPELPEVPNKYQGPYLDAYEMVQEVNRVKSNAEQLSPEDVDKFNTLRGRLVRTGIDNLTPQSIRNLAKEEGLELSDKATRFLNAINGLSVEQRHRLFGTQVTRGEEGIAVTILPSAPDLTLDGMMLRLDEQGEQNMERIRSIEQVTENMKGKRPDLMKGISFKRWGADERPKEFGNMSMDDLIGMSDEEFAEWERKEMEGM